MEAKCPLTGDWIEKMWYVHVMEYHRSQQSMKQCRLQQHGWIQRASRSAKQARKAKTIDSTYTMTLKKITQMNLRNRNKFTDRENKLMVTKGKRGREG